MARPRTLAIVATMVVALASAPSGATAGLLPPGAIEVFPVVGGASYYDDYGQARPQGHHEGNDLMARKRTPVVAAQNGTVKLSYGARSGYMITLYGRTREYYYIHLNNDIHGNDNRGGPRTAYARGLRNGMRVQMGQTIGYVGNSGDANSTLPHLHFEEHTLDGTPHDPYPNLRRAPIVLFGRPLKSSLAAATVIALDLTGRLAWVAEGTGSSRVALRLSNVRRVGGARIATSRLVVMRASKALVRRLANVAPGTGVTLRTAAATPTLERQMLRNGAWVLKRVVTIA